MLIANQVDETQHTDAIHLLTVDHSAKALIVADQEGGVHSFRQTRPLGAARDEAGLDLMVWLQGQDGIVWHPDLEVHAAQDSLTDTRNHIDLEFERPKGVDRVHLITNVGTGQWGSHMIRVMLGMRGNRVQEFHDAINGSEKYKPQLRAWNEREELFVLALEQEEGDR